MPSPGLEPSSLRANSLKASINPRGISASLRSLMFGFRAFGIQIITVYDTLSDIQRGVYCMLTNMLFARLVRQQLQWGSKNQTSKLGNKLKIYQGFKFSDPFFRPNLVNGLLFRPKFRICSVSKPIGGQTTFTILILD